MSVAVGDSDTAGDADGEGVAPGSAPIALTHIKTISANETRVAVIDHHRIEESTRNAATRRLSRRKKMLSKTAKRPGSWGWELVKMLDHVYMVSPLR